MRRQIGIGILAALMAYAQPMKNMAPPQEKYIILEDLPEPSERHTLYADFDRGTVPESVARSAFSQLIDTYRAQGIDIVERKGELAHDQVAIRLVEKETLVDVIRRCFGTYPHEMTMMTVLGFADVDRRTAYINLGSDLASIDTRVFTTGLANVMAHEVGHLLGCPHPETTPYDDVDDINDGVVNVMASLPSSETFGMFPKTGITRMQRRAINDFLARGSTYDAMGAERLDFLRYLEIYKRSYNMRYEREDTARKRQCGISR